jgi:hypothetical protein
VLCCVLSLLGCQCAECVRRKEGTRNQRQAQLRRRSFVMLSAKLRAFALTYVGYTVLYTGRKALSVTKSEVPASMAELAVMDSAFLVAVRLPTDTTARELCVCVKAFSNVIHQMIYTISISACVTQTADDGPLACAVRSWAAGAGRGGREGGFGARAGSVLYRRGAGDGGLRRARLVTWAHSSVGLQRLVPGSGGGAVMIMMVMMAMMVMRVVGTRQLPSPRRVCGYRRLARLRKTVPRTWFMLPGVRRCSCCACAASTLISTLGRGKRALTHTCTQFWNTHAHTFCCAARSYVTTPSL